MGGISLFSLYRFPTTTPFPVNVGGRRTRRTGRKSRHTPTPFPVRPPAFCESLAGTKGRRGTTMVGGEVGQRPHQNTHKGLIGRGGRRVVTARYVHGTTGARVCVLLLPSSLTVRREMARKRPTHPTGSSGVQAIMAAAAARYSRLLIKHVRKVVSDLNLRVRACRSYTDNGNGNNAFTCVRTVPKGGSRY